MFCPNVTVLLCVNPKPLGGWHTRFVLSEILLSDFDLHIIDIQNKVIFCMEYCGGTV